jgi:peptidoglycan-associated lipoprotein
MMKIGTRLGALALLVLAAAGTAAAAGCGGEAKSEPKTAANVADKTAPARGPAKTSPSYPNLPAEAPSSPTAGAVRISEEIATACGISQPESYFAFDSAKLLQEDLAVLDKVAACFASGPLRGRGMKLVGRADPRGGEEYNMTLGQSRADSVGTYLERRGVARSQLETTSRGAMDAVGTDEPSWARDRRVDVLLASR